MTTAAASLLAVEGVRHTYPARSTLAFPDFDISAGNAVALIGPSGSGKTTLLMLIAGLLAPQAGNISVAGANPADLRGAARDHWRGRTVGMVLQSFQLLPKLTVLENLTAAQYLSGAGVNIAAARDTLAALDIASLAHARPATLSRGQHQRAAIARAVVNRPKLVLADEPTSSLDDQSAAASLSLLLQQSQSSGAALLIATHDRRVMAQVPAIVSLSQAAPA